MGNQVLHLAALKEGARQLVRVLAGYEETSP
jgi:hypothetical protein